jgi:hypothetical protein
VSNERRVLASHVAKVCRNVLAGSRTAEGMCAETCVNPLFYEAVVEICDPATWVHFSRDASSAETFKKSVAGRTWTWR